MLIRKAMSLVKCHGLYITSVCFDIGIPYLAHGSITMRVCVIYNSWSWYDVDLWPQHHIYRVFDIFLCPFHNDFLFDIGLPYLAHESITMRRYDKYIHVPDLMLTSDFKVKFIGLLSCLHVRPVTSVSFHIGIPFSAHGSITVRECVKYIHDPNTTLTFNLKVKFIGLWHDFVFRPQLFLS